MQPGRAVVALILVLLAACTMRSAVETLTSPEDRAFAREVVTKLRSGDEAWLQQHFSPELWPQMAKQLGGVAALYPESVAETRLLSFSITSNMTNGTTERRKEFTLVTEGGGRWTVTRFATYSTGGPDRIVQWSVVPHTSPPPELTMIETWDRLVPWLWAGLLIGLIVIVAVIVLIVRHNRRRREAQKAQADTA